MSRSNPALHERAINPAKRFYEWSGKLTTGDWCHYDKEKKERIHTPGKSLPFFVLDMLHTVAGFNDDAQAGIYANMVRNMKSEPFTVKIFGNTRPSAEGVWENIKDRVGNIGGKYARCIFAAAYNKETSAWEVIQFKLTGAALSQWFEAERATQPYGPVGFRVISTEEKRKGQNSFLIPNFASFPIEKPSTTEAVDKLDKEVLQPYLEKYFQHHGEELDAATANTSPDHEPAPARKPSHDDFGEPTAQELAGTMSNFDPNADDIPF